MSRPEALRLVAALRKRRSEAIDNGDVAEIERLDAEIAAVESLLEDDGHRASPPPDPDVATGHEEPGPKSMRGSMVIAALLFFSVVVIGITASNSGPGYEGAGGPVDRGLDVFDDYDVGVVAEPPGAVGDLSSDYGPPASDGGGWRVRESTSSMDDSRSVYLSVDAENTISNSIGFATRPVLTLRCRENTTAAIVNFDVYLGLDDTRVRYRIDDQPARTQTWGISTANDAAGIWYGGGAIPFVRSLEGADQLVVETTPYGENAVEVRFDVSGLENVVAPLKEACGWS